MIRKKLLNYFAYGNDPIMHLGTGESGGLEFELTATAASCRDRLHYDARSS
ncbi:hypothetical protein OH492_12605 [Vibrio chagasii]|nr:hypothetical protein [Vibrio chagasii]